MFRLSALVLLAASVALAAPVPKGTDAKLYFPTTLGAKRVSETKQGDRTVERVETVTKVEEKDGVYTVTLERESLPKELATAVYRVSAEGVFHVSVGEAVTDPPAPVLKLGVKVGETWTSEEKLPVLGAAPPGLAGRTTKYTITMGKEEEIEVPAGKFKALRVERESGVSGAKSTLWYAAGVGVVKTETEVRGTTMATALKSFTPGKGGKKDEPKKDK